MKVSVCLAATRPDTVAAPVRSVMAQSYRDWELIVVAQRMIEPVRQAVAAAMLGNERSLTFVAQGGSGLSRARNAAVRAAQGDILAWLDDDCEAAPDWLATIVDVFGRHPEVGIVGGSLIAPAPERRWPRTCPAWVPAEVLREATLPRGESPAGFGWIGGDFAVRREVAERIGPFDEFLGAGSRFGQGEDLDYTLRAQAARVAMYSTPRARVRHTFGWRYGLGTILRHQRDLARGYGAVAAKLRLADDPFASTYRRSVERDVLTSHAAAWRAPVSATTAARRYVHFIRAYRECIAKFVVDADGVLAPRAG